MRIRLLILPACCLLALASYLPTRNFGATATTRPAQASRRYVLDYTQSTFIAHALRGGLLWFKGHEHLVAARVFSGEARLAPNQISQSSLLLTVKTDSMEETSDAFTDAQKKIINGELRDIVLEPAKYPEIVFKSTGVSGKLIAANQYDLRIKGDLTLHGVTRQIEIPTKVTVSGNDLRAVGEFSISRDDFNVKATSAFHGMVRVRDKVRFTFDIVGHE
ncbi:MAG TPA: YceI family protein [Pyrinomonadaceae bacterium]|nr:YceI family protein [Pyrinomonadaceae bacterium]